MSSEHVHRWVFDVMPMEIRCLACDDIKMSLDEGERRLNAMEGLRLADPVMYMALMSIVEAQKDVA